MPAGPWIMTQTWHDLLFAHWPLDAARLRSRLPPGIELDLYDGQGWIGVVPFHMTNVSARGVLALPWVSAFPELNVRTYVRVGDKPGVYFFSLDAANPLAVRTARALFHLPYHTANMQVRVSGDRIEYHSRRRRSPPAAFRAHYGPTGPAASPRGGSLDEFLTERYCLYVADSAGAIRRLEIHHPSWPLQPAEACIEVNTMAAVAGLLLPNAAPLLHFSKRQDVVAWPMRRVAD
jgi:uncharacterized protein YqjF (DUF2071 family)